MSLERITAARALVITAVLRWREGGPSPDPALAYYELAIRSDQRARERDDDPVGEYMHDQTREDK